MCCKYRELYTPCPINLNLPLPCKCCRMAKVTGSKLSLEDENDLMTAVKRSSSHKSSTGLSLSDFSNLFTRLSHEHYNQGEFLYHPGDSGDAMYFINSGKVEILTKKGHLVSILRHGDFFGEGALVEERNESKFCSKPARLCTTQSSSN